MLPVGSSRKSSFCGSSACIHITRGSNYVKLHTTGGDYILVTNEEFDAFLKGAKAGEFDAEAPTTTLDNAITDWEKENA